MARGALMGASAASVASAGERRARCVRRRALAARERVRCAGSGRVGRSAARRGAAARARSRPGRGVCAIATRISRARPAAGRRVAGEQRRVARATACRRGGERPDDVGGLREDGCGGGPVGAAVDDHEAVRGARLTSSARSCVGRRRRRRGVAWRRSAAARGRAR